MNSQDEIRLSITNETENVLDFEINNMVSNYTKPLGLRVKTYSNLCWIGDDNLNLFFQSILTKKEQSVEMAVREITADGCFRNEGKLEIAVGIEHYLFNPHSLSRYGLYSSPFGQPQIIDGSWQCFFVPFSNELKIKLSNIQPKSTLNLKFLL